MQQVESLLLLSYYTLRSVLSNDNSKFFKLKYINTTRNKNLLQFKTQNKHKTNCFSIPPPPTIQPHFTVTYYIHAYT
jgi:hypothetical protein